MTLQDFLGPNELIKYSCPDLVRHSGQAFNLHITNEKVVLHNIRGMLFKKDDIVAHRLSDIKTMSYNEKGIVSKKGVLEIHTNDRKLPLEGKPESMKALWQELQKYVKTETYIKK